MVKAHEFDATIQVAVEDAAGDLVVHHGREFTLVTNDPTYDEQLSLPAAQNFSNPSSQMALPGNVNAVDGCRSARPTPNSASTTPRTDPSTT